MKFKISIGIALLTLLPMQAQEGWTLQRCIEYALVNNINVKQKMISKENDEIALNSSKNARLPQVSAQVGENLSLGRAQNREGIYEDNTATSTSFGANLQVPLFTGFQITSNIALRKFNLLASTAELEQAKNDLAVNIASQFLQVLYNKEMLWIAEEQSKLSQRTVERTSDLVSGGRLSQADLYEAKSVQANDEASVTSARTTLKLSLVDLAQLLELTDVERFDIEAPALDAFAADGYTLLKAEQVFENAMAIRPSIKAANYRIESAKKAIKVAQAGWWPTLGFGAGISDGYYYYYNNTNNPSFGDQMKANRREYFALNLSIPIFDAFTARNNTRAARLQLADQTLGLELAQKKLLKEVQQAYYNSVASRDKYIAAEKAFEAAEIAYQYAQDKYETGRSTIFELNDSKTRVLKSRSTQAQTKYQFIFMSKILDFYNGKPMTLE